LSRNTGPRPIRQGYAVQMACRGASPEWRPGAPWLGSPSRPDQGQSLFCGICHCSRSKEWLTHFARRAELDGSQIADGRRGLACEQSTSAVAPLMAGEAWWQLPHSQSCHQAAHVREPIIPYRSHHLGNLRPQVSAARGCFFYQSPRSGSGCELLPVVGVDNAAAHCS